MMDDRVVELLNNGYSPYRAENINFALASGCLDAHIETLITALINADYKTIGVITRASITEFWEHQAENRAADEFLRSLG